MTLIIEKITDIVGYVRLVVFCLKLLMLGVVIPWNAFLLESYKNLSILNFWKINKYIFYHFSYNNIPNMIL